MSLLPDHASFHERVEACFSAYRGRGLMLSPLDLELVDQWARAEVPFEVIARGLKQAAASLGFDGQAPRFLSACRKKVEAEIARHFRSVAGRGDAPADGSRANRFFERQQQSLLAYARTHAAALLPPGAAKFPDWTAALESAEEPLHLERALDLFFAWALRVVPYPERRRLSELASGRIPEQLSAQAKLEAKRFFRAELVREFYAWPPPP